LHRALLSHALHALSARGAMTFTLESWGVSEANSADYLELGFQILESEAIVAWNAQFFDQARALSEAAKPKNEGETAMAVSPSRQETLLG